LLRIGVLGKNTCEQRHIFAYKGITHFLALVPMAWLSSLFGDVEVLARTGGTGRTGDAVVSLSALSCTKTCPEDLFFSWSSSRTAASGEIH
jgi:hypothetical protein